MINDTITTTRRESNQKLTDRATAATVQYARQLIDTYKEFWKGEPSEILAELNRDPALYIARFTQNTAVGTAINAALEQAGQGIRVIVSMPDGYSFNGTEFVYTPTAN